MLWLISTLVLLPSLDEHSSVGSALLSALCYLVYSV
jgi:hypothetical protein